jgi:hypothetical protein
MRPSARPKARATTVVRESSSASSGTKMSTISLMSFGGQLGSRYERSLALATRKDFFLDWSRIAT